MGLAYVKEMIKRDVNLANNRNENKKESNYSPLQIKARRLLAGFFIMMIILTILSRAADSITVAQVVTHCPKESILTFTASGTGKIVADMKKYIKIPENLDVSQINVKVGQKVKKGDVLLSLDSNGLRDAVKTAKVDVDKLCSDIEQEEITGSAFALSTQEKAKLSYSNSVIDLKIAIDNYKSAKDEYAEAYSEKKAREKSYYSALLKDKDKILKEKTQEYKTAKASYDSVSISNTEALEEANNNYESAKNDLDELNEMDHNILNFLECYSNYYGKDTTLAHDALEGLYQMAYGNDSDTYLKHKSDVALLELKSTQARLDLSQVTDLYTNRDGTINDSTAYQIALKSAQRALSEAEENLTSATKKENNIKTEAIAYRDAVQISDNNRKEKSIFNIKQYIYGSSGYNKHQKDIYNAEKKVQYTKDCIDRVIKKNNIALSTEQDKIDTITIELESIKNGTYDYDSAADKEKNEFDTAKQNVITKKQAVKTAKEAVTTSKRTREIAKFDYEQAVSQDNNARNTKTRQEKALGIKLKALRMDLEAKKQTVDTLQHLQNNKGRIKAPVSGTVDSITYEAGKKSISDNSIAINTGGYGYVGSVPKEQGEYISVGDEMQLTAKGKKDKIMVNVEGIRYFTDEQGIEQTEVTAVMPKGEYIPGATLSAEITKNSELYDSCIPLSAVREDQKGNYCLMTEPRNTILGKELLAVRVAIKIVEKDSMMAAVDSALSSDNNVIISSNKNIEEGDRVRLQ